MLKTIGALNKSSSILKKLKTFINWCCQKSINWKISHFPIVLRFAYSPCYKKNPPSSPVKTNKNKYVVGCLCQTRNACDDDIDMRVWENSSLTKFSNFTNKKLQILIEFKSTVYVSSSIEKRNYGKANLLTISMCFLYVAYIETMLMQDDACSSTLWIFCSIRELFFIGLVGKMQSFMFVKLKKFGPLFLAWFFFALEWCQWLLLFGLSLPL